MLVPRVELGGHMGHPEPNTPNLEMNSAKSYSTDRILIMSPLPRVVLKLQSECTGLCYCKKGCCDKSNYLMHPFKRYDLRDTLIPCRAFSCVDYGQ